MEWKGKKKKRRGNVFQCWLLGPFQCASVEVGCVCEKGTEELVRERERGVEREGERRRGILAALLLLSSFWNQFVT